MRALSPLFAAATVLALVAPATVHAASSARQRSWSAGWSIPGRPEIHLDTDDALVRVHATSGDSVRVHVYSAGRANGVIFSRREPEVRFDREGQRVDIEVRSGSTSGILVMSSHQMEIDVWAPRTSDVSLRTGDGRVELAGLSGRIEAQTGDGAIRARQLSGVVSLRSGDGHITAEGIVGSLMVDTRDGGADVRGRFSGLGVESGDGRVDVTLERGSDLAQGGSVESGDGRITVRVPQDMKLTFDARTEDGALHVGLPITVHESGGRRSVAGEINGGGPRLRVRSRDGSVRIEAL